MVEELTAAVCFFLVVAAEVLHLRRCRRLRALTFAGGRPRPWIHAAPVIRAVAAGLMGWGLMVLLRLPPGGDSEQDLAPTEDARATSRHVVVILDVSPSMRIQDAGSTGVQKRAERAVDVMDSVLERVARDDVRYSLVAVYSDARPVIVASLDAGVVRNIMELPLEQAFSHGQTHLIKGVEAAFDISKDWTPRSTTYIMLTDGDTVNVGAAGLPDPPKSLAEFVVAGIGTRRGAFIDGHQSRQDTSTLRFLATRFRGFYHDVNARHIPTSAIGGLAGRDEGGEAMKWTRRQLAVAACGAGALLLALTPILLELFGFDLSKHLAARQQLPARAGA